MEENRTSLEIIAPSVEEAIAQGLEELGLPENAVDIEVLDLGSKGLFGLGTRDARIRLTVKTEEERLLSEKLEAELQSESVSSQEATELDEEEKVVEVESEEIIEEENLEEAPAVAEEVEERTFVGEEKSLDGTDDAALYIARQTVEELIEKMKVKADVDAYWAEPDDEHSRAPLMVEITGKDLSVLIGPRAETLNALQYVAGLIIGKELGRSVPLIVDVEGYRARRKEQIRRLANRMAEQAIATGRKQILEPMPASERRLVHIELRNNPQVITESIGDEPRRKVTIIPVGESKEETESPDDE